MLKNFLTMLVSSWVMNSLWVLLAQHYGESSNSTVILILLSSATQGVYLLFINECLTPGVVQNRFALKYHGFAIICSFQAIAFFASTFYTSMNFDLISVLILLFIITANSVLSYITTAFYYDLVANALINAIDSFFMGVIPGVVSTVVFTFYIIASENGYYISSRWLLLIPAVPPIVHWLYVKRLTFVRGHVFEFKSKFELSNSALLFFTCFISVFCFAGLQLREDIATRNLDYAALIILLTNITASIANVVTRVLFFNNKNIPTVFYFVLILFLVFTAFFVYAISISFSQLIFIIALQMTMVWIISIGRNIPVAIPVVSR